MSQDSLVHSVVGVYGGAAMVAKQNDANAAMNSSQSGGGEPASKVAGSSWFDTALKLFKRRDSANAAWLTAQHWNTTTVTAGTTTLGGDELGEVLIDASADNVTLNVPAATIGKAAFVMPKRIDTSSNTVTVQVTGGGAMRQMNRLTSTTMKLIGAGDFVSLISDGVTYWDVLGRAPALSLIGESQSVSGVASVEFTQGINADFAAYVLMGTGVIPGTNNANVWLRVSEDGGSTWKQGAGDYTYMWSYAKDDNTGGTSGSAGAAAQIILANAIGNSGATLGGGCDFEATIYNAAGSTQRKRAISKFIYLDGAGTGIVEHLGGTYRGTTNPVNGFQVKPSTGVFSGTFSLYGVRK